MSISTILDVAIGISFVFMLLSVIASAVTEAISGLLSLRSVTLRQGIERLLKDLSHRLDALIYFDVSRPELMRRLTGRRVCRACGHSFHLVSSPPQRAGVCDVCGGELYQRVDDSDATVRNRLEVYERQTAPLLEHYKDRGLDEHDAGEGPNEVIRKKVRAAAEGHA